MQHQQIYFHTYFNLKCYLFALGASIYTCTHSESHAVADQTLPASVCGEGATGDQRSLLLSRHVCTAGVPPHPPSSAMNLIINLSNRTSHPLAGSLPPVAVCILHHQPWACCFTHPWVCAVSQASGEGTHVTAADHCNPFIDKSNSHFGQIFLFCFN